MDKNFTTCKLCEILSNNSYNSKVENTILLETDNFRWIPGLGAFVEGYSLIVSKSHCLNTSLLSDHVIDELEDLISIIKNSFNSIYGKDIIIFEHGTMSSNADIGNCIDHHHLHILPTEINNIPDILLKETSLKIAKNISSLRDLKKLFVNQIPYFYLYLNNKHIVFEIKEPGFPSQYLRQVFAHELNQPHDWDWRKKPFLEKISSFVKKLEIFKSSKNN